MISDRNLSLSNNLNNENVSSQLTKRNLEKLREWRNYFIPTLIRVKVKNIFMRFQSI